MIRHASRISIFSFNLFSDIFLYFNNRKLDTYWIWPVEVLYLASNCKSYLTHLVLPTGKVQKFFRITRRPNVYNVFQRISQRIFSKEFYSFSESKIFRCSLRGLLECDFTLHNFLKSMPSFGKGLFGEWDNAKYYTVNIPKVM